MPDQLRYNALKPQLSVVFASARALERLDELTEDDICVIACRAYLPYTLLETARFLDRGPLDHQHLTHALVAVLLELEEDLSPGFESPSIFENVVEFVAKFPRAFRELTYVYEYGAKKYERGNYRRGAPLTSYVDSALRHLFAYARGETNDRESGHHHLAHTLWNFWIALDLPAHRDDRLPAAVNDGGEEPEDEEINDEDDEDDDDDSW